VGRLEARTKSHARAFGGGSSVETRRGEKEGGVMKLGLNTNTSPKGLLFLVSADRGDEWGAKKTLHGQGKSKPALVAGSLREKRIPEERGI